MTAKILISTKDNVNHEIVSQYPPMKTVRVLWQCIESLIRTDERNRMEKKTSIIGLDGKRMEMKNAESN